MYNKTIEHKTKVKQVDGGNPFRENYIITLLQDSDLTIRQIAKRFDVSVKAVNKINKQHKCR